MKNLPLYLLLVLSFVMSCSENDDSSAPSINSKSVTDCDTAFNPNTISGICLNGAELASPNEIITYASKHATSHGISNPQFNWIIENGSIEILNIENSIVDAVTAKSIATIKFNSDFSGNGIIKVMAETDHSEGETEIFVEMEE
ncbi:hypothetical protein [Formosa sp. A9]|uniref:hypothetical protein n=1 Tax=Formosa sp. A9 TaxID=3442641 RepID=UPI003EC08F77